MYALSPLPAGRRGVCMYAAGTKLREQLYPRWLDTRILGRVSGSRRVSKYLTTHVFMNSLELRACPELIFMTRKGPSTQTHEWLKRSVFKPNSSDSNAALPHMATRHVKLSDNSSSTQQSTHHLNCGNLLPWYNLFTTALSILCWAPSLSRPGAEPGPEGAHNCAHIPRIGLRRPFTRH